MAIHFTPQQEKVLCARDHNILVSAAAGSGKTAVLVERIIRMISEGDRPHDIDRLLVVTFTRAAAAQMRERISAAIADRLQKDPGNEHLQRQETLMHNAQITTMDSFFTVVVRNQFSEIGLDPAFRQMDEEEAKLLLADVMDEYLEQLHGEADPAFQECLAFFAQGGSDEKFASCMREMYKRAVSHPDPEGWLAARGEDYEVRDAEDLLRKSWLRGYLRTCVERAADLAGRFDSLIEVCREADGPYPYEEALLTDRAFLRELLHIDPDEAEAGTLWEILRKMAAYDKPGLPAIRGKKAAEIDKAKKEYVKNSRDEIHKQLKVLYEDAAGTDPAQEAAVMRRVSPQVRKLSELTLGFLAAFREAKRKKNVIDFNDLEHFALEILAQKREDGTYGPTRAAMAYKRHFDEILIDEYQDSNDVQEILLRVISTEEEGRYNRFMVGDVKQSIYKFRQARPEIFMDKYARYREDDPETERIDLDRNFRSRREVLNSVNAVFERVMRREIGGVTYDGRAALKPGASFPEAPAQDGASAAPYVTELLVADTTAAQDGTPEFAALSKRKKEALLVAGRIRQLVGSLPVTENGQQRPCRYGDIVILLRSPSGKEEEYRAMLESQGIPVYVESRTGYFAAQEIRTVLALLQVLDNPLQDIPLYGVMHSSFGNFSQEEAAQIRLLKREGSLFDALLAFAQAEMAQASEAETAQAPGTFALREKTRRFLHFLKTWREKRRWLSVHELLEELLEETGYEDYCRALPGGEQRGANLYLLKAQAQAFDKMAVSGLFSFVRYIEQVKKREIDYGEANIAGDQADVVRIMSIHKSKGLEFPVCFVCGLAGLYSFRRQDTRGSFLLDNELGIGTELFVQNPGMRAPTLRQKAVADKIGRDSLGEELRVLYVAMTRAQEKLILTGTADSEDKTLTKWENSVPDHPGDAETALPAARIEGTDSYLALLGMAVCSVQKTDPAAAESLFRVQFMGEKEIAEMASGAEEMRDLTDLRESLETKGDALPDPALARALEERFSRVYAAQRLEGLCTMTSVSELKRAAMEEQLPERSALPGEEEPAAGEAAELYPPEIPFPTIPFFAEEEGGEASASAEPDPAAAEQAAAVGALAEAASGEKEAGAFPQEKIWLRGTDYGTAVHRLLELFPYHRFPEPADCTVEELGVWIRELADSGRIPQEYADGIRPGALLSFLRSPLAARMAAADAAGKLFREQPFVLGISADRLPGDYPPEETVMVQGIIDAFFEEDGQLVLVDYKTDRVDTPEELVRRYAVQLAYYTEALERITGRKVKEKMMFSLRLGREVRV